MRRKVIKQGHNTLTITIPSKWAKQFNLKSGDEIDVLAKENGLFITTEKKDEKKKIEIDISNLDIPLIWKYFMSVYREGYDEVKVKFNPNESYDSPYKFFTRHAVDLKYGKKSRQHSTFETIQEITNRFIGFEIVEHHKDYFVIRDLAELTSKEFETSLRRVFLLILQMGEELIEAIKTNNVEMVKHTHDIDINVDKFHDYCVRVLNKTSFKETRETNLIFTMLYILEMIGDEFKNVSFHLLEDMKGKKLNNLEELGTRVAEQLNKFYDLFYNYTKEKAIEMSKGDQEIYFYFPVIYKKKPGKGSELSDDELEIFNHFRRIARYINAVTELRTEMEFST
ncbi:MAG: AbrB/MazE/SpoVT family DNA-binding domain-containing protein [Nanoarchaeota archaeon]